MYGTVGTSFLRSLQHEKKERNIDDRYEWYKDFIYKLFPIKVLSINLLNKMYTFYCKNPRNWMKELLDLRN